MTKKDLIKKLEEFKDDDIIVLSKDGEGNGFSPLYDLDASFYCKENSWSGEIDGDADSGGVPCVVLWPTN